MRVLRDSFSANERRIADFILDNSQFMRDYSSQQLASAVNVSQSGIVKFSQKLGYKGYPDLKMAINESVVKERVHLSEQQPQNAANQALNPLNVLQQQYTESLHHSQDLNNPESLLEIAHVLLTGEKVVIVTTQHGISAARHLASYLLDQGRYCRFLKYDNSEHIPVLEKLAKGDIVVVFADNPYSSALSVAISNLPRQQVKTVLINRAGDSSLYQACDYHLQWVASAESELSAKFQTETMTTSLVFALLMAMEQQLISRN